MFWNKEDKISNYLIEYPEIETFKKWNNLKTSKDIFIDDFKPFDIENSSNKIIWKNIIKNDCKIFSENYKNCSININDNSLGNLNNCLNILKERPELIKRIIEIDDFNDSESNGVWLNIDNNWRLIIIDYFFPFILNDGDKENFLYSYSSDNSIWNNMIEKALAKSLGSYKNISIFSFEELFYQITGIMPNITLLEEKLDCFYIIKNGLNLNKIISCFKTSKFNNGKLKDAIINNKQYIICDYIIHNENFGIKLKSVKELENYKSLEFLDLDDKNYISMSWEEFLEEFEFITVINPESHYINNFKIDNKNTSLIKLFLNEENLFNMNFIQNSYDQEEISFGIQDWIQPQKEILLNLKLNKEDKNEYVFKRSRTSKIVENSEHNLKFLKIISEFDVDFIDEFNFNDSFHSKNIKLMPGEYLIIINSEWKDYKLLNSLSIQINSQFIFDLQNINCDNKLISHLNSKIIYNKIEKENSKYLTKGNDYLNFNNNYIKINEINENNEKIYIFSTDTEKPILIKFKSFLKDNATILSILNEDRDIDIDIEINKENQGIIKLSNQNSYIKFKGLEYLDDLEFNKIGKFIFDFKKYKNLNKFFYLSIEKIQEGCGGNCKIF